MATKTRLDKKAKPTGKDKNKKGKTALKAKDLAFKRKKVRKQQKPKGKALKKAK